ncbi:MAG TPA: N-6 DNA methylase, partial [Aggregatilineales bacterium]|nr:N-6 DNA methylase [Aggregatilineales bacterium]
VRRFGSHSPTFQAAARIMAGLLAKVKEHSTVTIKRTQWRRLLAKVYGSDIGSDELFIRHTFLNQFAKLLAYSSLASIPHDDTDLVQIVTGEAFNRFGVSNIGEVDFFAWVLDDPAVRSDVTAMLRRLAQSLNVYDLKRVNEDLLKQLYQNLVEPETRHDLGEFYTPDWLAELTLKEIDYRPGLSLLDPACGSGTFLFMAIRQLAARGLTGWKLVDFALENIAGMDVHPLAVTIARINYLLAIIPHMRGARSGGEMGLPPLPVYLADALLTSEDGTLKLPVDTERGEIFHIPDDAARAPAAFSDVIDQMEEYAKRPTQEINLRLSVAFGDLIRQRFTAVQRGVIGNMSPSYWGQNLTLLNRLITEGRDSIWAYILKNQARPLLLSEQKFDVIVGNPPWLSYRYIKDRTYQAEVKALYRRYELIEGGDVKLFTQMDLSTLTMVHCEAAYLKPGGLIAFVMPRSVITGAKQHRPFQARGLTRVLDLLGIFPLFNVPTAVLIRRPGEVYADAVPTTRYNGRLPRHQMPLSEAEPRLTCAESATHFVGEAQVGSPYYYDKVKQGATLVPRNLCFVKPEQAIAPGDYAFNPSMTTDPDVDTEAKVPWKWLHLRGKIYAENLYATLLSKNLMPFGVRRLHLVALPVRVEGQRLKPMDEYDFLAAGHADSWRTWFEPANQKW